MSFIKNFIFNKTEGLKLTNTSERDNYLSEKVKHFSEYKNFSNKDELLNFFQEIIAMNNHDITTAQFDFSDFNNMVGFKLEDKKEQIIYFYNIVVMLGTVFFNVFDRKGNRLSKLEEGADLPFKTTDMFGAGYNELLMAKQYGVKNAFGATLIFTTLLERDLKTLIKLVYMEELLKELETKIALGNISLTSEDEDLYFYLRYQNEIDTKNNSTKEYESYYASRILAYNLFESNGIITTDKDFYKGIFGIKNSFTLNSLITSQKFKDKVDVRFWEIIDIMFSPGKLNLRNNLTHGNTGYQNYYHINITALMYGLYCMLSTKMILK